MRAEAFVIKPRLIQDCENAHVEIVARLERLPFRDSPR
jgi:hypothetical protein